MFRRYARIRQPTECDVQLLVAGAAGPCGSSVATDSGDGGSGIEGTIAKIQRDLLGDRTPVDPTGEVATGAVVASTVHSSQRAVINGTAGIQLVIPMVRRFEHG